MYNLNEHYVNQVGGKMSFFAGVPNRIGNGFFSRMFSGVGGFLKDLIPSLGKRVLPSAINLAQDVMSGENVGRAAKRRLTEAGKNIADETLTKLQTRLHTGSGIISRMRQRPIRFVSNNKRKNIKRKHRKKSNKRRKTRRTRR